MCWKLLEPSTFSQRSVWASIPSSQPQMTSYTTYWCTAPPFTKSRQSRCSHGTERGCRLQALSVAIHRKMEVWEEVLHKSCCFSISLYVQGVTEVAHKNFISPQAWSHFIQESCSRTLGKTFLMGSSLLVGGLAYNHGRFGKWYKFQGAWKGRSGLVKGGQKGWARRFRTGVGAGGGKGGMLKGTGGIRTRCGDSRITKQWA